MKINLKATADHCRNGHELTPENIGMRNGKTPSCKQCDKSRLMRRRKNFIYWVRTEIENINGPNNKYKLIGNLTEVQFNLLDLLHVEGSSTYEPICTRVFNGNVDNTKRRISEFVRKGLIEAQKNPLPVEPERKSFYSPTDLGKRAYQEALRSLEESCA